MSNEFAIVERAIGPVIAIGELVAQWRMPATLGRGYPRIADYRAQQGAGWGGTPSSKPLAGAGPLLAAAETEILSPLR